LQKLTKKDSDMGYISIMTFSCVTQVIPSKQSILSVQVVFVPQRPIAAPGASLREQLVYPSTLQASHYHLAQLLGGVQLDHLLQRVHGSWEQPHDWQGGSNTNTQSPPR